MLDKKRYFLLPLIFFLYNLSIVEATHIVGGELNYQHLGGSSYNLSIKLYRDCKPGSFGLPISTDIQVYDFLGNEIDQFVLSRQTIEFVDPDIDNPCLIVPPELCLEFGFYSGIVSLPPSSTPRTLTFSVCCRNSSVVNAVGLDSDGDTLDIVDVGAIYTTTIPGIISNSNPEYKELPPIVLCNGENINFDHSATDADGDSLVYSICTPFDVKRGTGSGPFGGSNVIDGPPPYEELIWVSPYGLDNVIGGSQPLSIDPVTGLLTGNTPDIEGQFVVGICVQEYRDGVLLSENKRDFQFNVTNCNKLYNSDYEITGEPFLDIVPINTDSFSSYTLLCDTNLSVQFENLVSETSSLLWNFGDGSGTQTSQDPIHLFSDTGFYVVSLIAAPGEVCADTFRQLINIQYQQVNADFTFEQDLADCYDPVSGITFTDLSEDQNEIASWNWNFGNGLTSELQNPVAFFSQSDLYPITLSVTEKNGCITSYSQNIEISRLDTFILADTLFACQNDTFEIPFSIEGSSHNFIWSPEAAIVDPTIQNPKITISETTTFSVQIQTISLTGDTCYQNGTTHIIIDPPIANAQADPQSLIIPQEVQLSANFDADYSYTWTPDSMLSDNSINDPIAFVEETTLFIVTVTDENGCLVTDSINVILIPEGCEKAVFVPNAITPNGDGLNDVFRIQGDIVEEMYMEIRDRWGNLVFSTNDINEGWDGTTDNHQLGSDAFGFMLNVRCIDGDTFTKSGSITVIR